MKARSITDEPWVLLICRKAPFNSQLGPLSTFRGQAWRDNWKFVVWYASYRAVQKFRPEMEERIKAERKMAWENPEQYERSPSLKL